MSYRISVPEYKEIASIYCDLAEECTRALRQFYSEIVENCKKCRYKPMVDFANQIYDFYFGDFYHHLMRQFNDWENSEYSLDNLTRRIGAGEDAARIGKRYMGQIKAALDKMFSNGIMEKPGEIDTSEPEIDNQTILDNNDYIRGFLRKARNALSEAISKVRRHANENDAYSCIIGIVNTTGNSMIDSFETMLSEVSQGEYLFNYGSQSSIEPAEADSGKAIDASGSMNWSFDGPFI